MRGQQTLGREFIVLEHIREPAAVRQSAGAELNVNEVVTEKLENSPLRDIAGAALMDCGTRTKGFVPGCRRSAAVETRAR